ncbi:hypothetical protein CQZ93_13335 [Ochrobactrum vermis]|nr:hypothetical protein CQZ93_13335 [Ochrobactrum vermis]
MLPAHHVNEFDASQYDTGSNLGLEAEHAPMRRLMQQSLTQQALHSLKIAVSAEQEHNRIANTAKPLKKEVP